MMRKIGCLASLLLATTALADDSADDKAFRDFVTRAAAEDRLYVEQWWSANLDGDPALERVAVLCPKSADDHKGYFLIEKDSTHRWEIAFDVDSRTRACTVKAGATPPKLEPRKTTVVELYQAHLAGYESMSFALRIGQPVIVREEELTAGGKKPVVKDWDLLIKKKKEKNYRVPENLRQLNN